VTACTLAGVLTGDTVTCAAAGAAFDTAPVGTGKTVTATGITLNGVDAGNYTLSSTTATTTANITAVQVTASVTAANKAYDKTTTATITTCTLAGALAGDAGTVRGAGPDVRYGGGGHGEDGHRGRNRAQWRGRGKLCAVEHDGHDDREHHRGDGHRDRDRREQGLRRHDERDRHELHLDGHRH